MPRAQSLFLSGAPCRRGSAWSLHRRHRARVPSSAWRTRCRHRCATRIHACDWEICPTTTAQAMPPRPPYPLPAQVPASRRQLHILRHCCVRARGGPRCDSCHRSQNPGQSGDPSRAGTSTRTSSASVGADRACCAARCLRARSLGACCCLCRRGALLGAPDFACARHLCPCPAFGIASDAESDSALGAQPLSDARLPCAWNAGE